MAVKAEKLPGSAEYRAENDARFWSLQDRYHRALSATIGGMFANHSVVFGDGDKGAGEMKACAVATAEWVEVESCRLALEMTKRIDAFRAPATPGTARYSTRS